MTGPTERLPRRSKVRWGGWLDAKTGALLLGLLALAAGVGYLLLGGLGILLGALAIIMLAGGAQLPPHLTMQMEGAARLTPWDLPGLHRMVAALAQRAGAPSPQLYLVPTYEANAFTTGSPSGGGALAITEGALGLLDRDELEGILAHEVAHIANRDTVLLRLATTTSHVMTMLLSVSLWLALPIIFLGGLTYESIFVLAAVAIAAPVGVTLLVAALSRTRELAADAAAAALTGKPLALASALRKLERQRTGWFGPFFVGGHEVPELLRSHPSTELRIERLRELVPTKTKSTRSDTPARRPALPPRSPFPVWHGR